MQSPSVRFHPPAFLIEAERKPLSLGSEGSRIASSYLRRLHLDADPKSALPLAPVDRQDLVGTQARPIASRKLKVRLVLPGRSRDRRLLARSDGAPLRVDFSCQLPDLGIVREHLCDDVQRSRQRLGGGFNPFRRIDVGRASSSLGRAGEAR